MKCIIVDDEPLAREGMELNVSDISFLELVGQFDNALKANDYIKSNEVDLMFLDIQMPGITGLDFLRSLSEKPMTIMTTAYPQHALEGFELDVVDYLVKPIRMERFLKAANKAKEIYDLHQVQKVSPNEVESIAEEFIYIRSERKLIRLFFKDILYIKGMKDYVLIFEGQRKVMTAMNIKTIHAQLPASMFARVGKSSIINVNFIDSIDNDFILIGKEEIPLGRTYKDHFINTYIKGNIVERK